MIPTIIVLKPNGDVITKNGKQHIISMGEDAFNKWL